MSEPPQQPGGWGPQPPPQPGEGPGWPPPGPGQPPTRVGGFTPVPQPPTQVGGFRPGPQQPPPGGQTWGPPAGPGWNAPPGGPGWNGPPGGPGWSGGPYGPDPSGGRRRGSGPLIAGIAVLAVVVVVVTVLAFTLTRGDGDDGGTAAAPAPVSSAAPSRPSGSPAPLPPPTATGGPAEAGELDAFLATLPEAFTDCRATQPAADGDLLAAECGQVTGRSAPTAARFYLYPDVATLDQVFTDDVLAEGLTEFPDGQDCSTGLGYGGWDVGGAVGGMVGCAILDDGTVTIAWTDDEFLTEGIVAAPGTTQADVAELYDWWRGNSSYRG